MRLTDQRWLIATLLLLLMSVLAIGALDADPIRMPEYNSIIHTGYIQDTTFTVSDILHSVQDKSAQHAPLYFVLLTGWAELVSIHPAILRVVSVYFALLTMAFTYRLGLRIDRRWGGVIAVFLLTFSAFNLFYTHEIRNYTVLSFASVLVMWAYWRVMTAKGQVHFSRWLWLYGASVWCVYTHYFGIFPLLGIGFFHLFFVQKNRRWVQVAVVEVIAGLSFLPWLPVVIEGTSTRKYLESDSQVFIEVIYRHLFAYGNGLWFLLIGLLTLILYQLWRQRKRLSLEMYIVVVGLVMLGAMVGVNELSTVIPIRRMRYTMVWLPQVTLMVTLGVVYLSSVRWLQGLILVAWVAGAIWFNQSDVFLDYTGVGEQDGHKYPNYQILYEYYEDLPGQDELIVSVGKDVWVTRSLFLFYEREFGYQFFHATDDLSQFEETANMWQFTVSNLQDISDDASFWVFTDPQRTDLEDVQVFQAGVGNTSRMCRRVIDRPAERLDYYVRADIPCELVSEPYPMLVYDNGLRLLNLVTEKQDDSMGIYTWWDDKPTDPYGFSIQLFNEAGEKVGQGDYLLPSGTIQINEMAVDDLPAGTYQVQLVLYDLDGYNTQSGMISATDESFERIVTVDTVTLSHD